MRKYNDLSRSLAAAHRAHISLLAIASLVICTLMYVSSNAGYLPDVTSTARAADDSPLTIAAIGKMRLAKKSNDQIIEAAKTRGIAFDFDSKTKGRLRAMRFKADQIELLGQIKDGTYAKLQAEQAAAKAKFEASKPKAPKAGTAPQGVFLGPRISDARHATILDRVTRIWKSSNTKTKMHSAETITVVCSEKSAKVHLTDVKKIEALIRKRFEQPLKTGTDKRSAFIVLLDTRYDYESWVKTMFKIYAADGITWGGGGDVSPLQMALKGPAFYTPNMVVADLSGLKAPFNRHNPVFAVGYLYMEGLMEGKSPDVFSNGFGNECEVMMFGKPAVRLVSYDMRELGATMAWKQTVKNLLQNGKLHTMERVTRYSTSLMDADQYSVAWSLTQFLSQDQDRYNRLLNAIRDKQITIAAITTVYGKTEAELTKAWHVFIKKQ